MEPRHEFVVRARRLANLFIKASDEWVSLAAELKYRGWDKPAEEGGISPDTFSGANADITREDLLALFALLDGLLTPLTPEQRAVFYKMRASSQQLSTMPVTPTPIF